MIIFQRRAYPPLVRALRITGALMISLVLGLSSPAQAELILNAEVRITVEDSIVGLLSGEGRSSGTSAGAMGASAMQAVGKGFGNGGSGSGTGTSPSYTGSGSQSPGDLSVTTAAELGGMTTASRFRFFATGFAERTDYRTYSEYDSTIAGVTAGMNGRLSDVLSLRVAGVDKIKRYDNDPYRDGTAYGGSASLKQLITDDLWLREGATYETYRAVLQDFSNRGTTYRFTAGYDLTDDLLVTAGYRFQAQHYQDSASTALRTGTAMLGMDYYLTDRWSTWLLYERQASGTGTSDVITRNNILSLALRWDY